MEAPRRARAEGQGGVGPLPAAAPPLPQASNPGVGGTHAAVALAFALLERRARFARGHLPT